MTDCKSYKRVGSQKGPALMFSPMSVVMVWIAVDQKLYLYPSHHRMGGVAKGIRFSFWRVKL